MNTQITPSPKDTITEQVAINITTNWRDYIGKIEPDDKYIRAFNIPMSDIQNLADFSKCPSVRAYLAMETPGDISTLKIILVPVDADNKDVLSIPVGQAGAEDEQSSIYDFTNPCPKICDVDSPLFQNP
ncbi:MAG: hypothetical protein IPP48_00110 [Chitinophagaceae bacterium]|nr:hypothetical protein [Chitinophagaceae bacterium]